MPLQKNSKLDYFRICLSGDEMWKRFWKAIQLGAEVQSLFTHSWKLISKLHDNFHHISNGIKVFKTRL